MDLFGQPLTLRYKDSYKFKTALGGLSTFIVGLGILTYFFILLKQMIKHEKTHIVNSLQRNGDLAFDYDHNITLTKDNFDIAISLDYIGALDDIDLDEYFQYAISPVYYELVTDPKKRKELGNNFIWNQNRLPLVRCQSGRFGGLKNQTRELGIDN